MSTRPPRLIRALLSRCIPRADRRTLVEELDELYVQRVARLGRPRAIAWYLLQIASFGFRVAGEGIRLRGAQLRPHTGFLMSDFRMALRRLMRRPGYVVAAAVTLGVGIGGVATVYSAAEWVLLRPVPGVPHPDSLILLRLEDKRMSSSFGWPISNADLQDLSRRMSSLSAIAGSTDEAVHLLVGGDTHARRVAAELVTANYFSVLGMAPAAGRFFAEDEHRGGAGPAEVVISHRLWRRLWTGGREAVGSAVRVNGAPYTVVGVAPRGFHGAELPGSADAWFPPSAVSDLRPTDKAGRLADQGLELWNRLVGRRTPGASLERIAAESNTAREAIRQQSRSGRTFYLTDFVLRAYEGIGLSPWIRASVERTLEILGATGVLLLLLAAANVTNLGLARTASRRREAAIRRALGAGVARGAREPLLEGIIIGACGAALAMGIVLAGARIFRDASLSARGASLEGMTVDLRVAAFSVVMALAVGVAAGVMPAIACARVGTDVLRSGFQSVDRLSVRFRSVVVVVQMALSTVLLVGAGLLARTMANFQAIDLGMTTDRLVTFSLEPGLQQYDSTRTRALLLSLRRHLEQEPGVSAVGFVSPAPLQGWYFTAGVEPPGAESPDETVIAAGYRVSPGFLETMGMEFLAGTDLEAPALGNETDVILSEAAARGVFPDIDPRAVPGRSVVRSGRDQPVRVAGVVHDARFFDVRAEPGPLLFESLSGTLLEGTVTVYVCTTGPEAALLGRIPGLVGEVDPGLPAYALQTGDEQVAALLSEQHVVARLAAILAGIGLLLAAVGLYGVLGYAVTERTREIGVRCALGAGPGTILRDVVRRGLTLASVGAVLGLPTALLLSDLLEARLYGVASFDVVTYAAGLVVLLSAAVVASWRPARRAMSISPTDALRAE